MGSQSKRIYLHGATIDEESVELLGGLGSGVCPDELDRGDATASTILVVGEHDPSDRTSRLVEVFLYRKQRRSVFSSDNFSESVVLECRKVAAQTMTAKGESISEHTASIYRPFHPSIGTWNI